MPVTPESNAANRISLHRFSMINGGSAAAGSPRGGLAPSCAHDVTSNRAPKPRGLVGRITPKPPDQWSGSLTVLTLLAIVAPIVSGIVFAPSSSLGTSSFSSARFASHGGPTGSFNRGQRSKSPGTNTPQASIKISEVSVRFFVHRFLT